MKLWKSIAINIMKVYSAVFGLTLVGLIFGVTTALIYLEIPANIFMQLFFNASLAFLSTFMPYFMTFLSVCGWYMAEVFNILRLRKEFPSIKFTLDDFLTVLFKQR